MANSIHIVMTGDERNAYQAMQRLIQQQAQMQAGLGNVAKSSKDAGGALATAFGSSALSSLASYAAGMVSLGAAIGLVTKALDDLKKKREEAAAGVAATEVGFGSLGELAGGDPAKHRRLIEQAKSIYRQGGAKDLEGASRLVYQLESADVPQEWRDNAHKLYPTIAEPEKLIGGISTLRKSLGPAEAGTFDQLYSKGVVAGAKTQQSAAATLAAAARTGPAGKALGLHDEELLAATSILGGTTGSVDEGATQVDAFLHSIIEGKAGKFAPGTSLAEIVKTIDKKGYSNEKLEKLLGRKESFSGFVGLRDRMGEYQGQLADIDAANANPDAMERIFKSNMQQPELLAAREARIGKAASDLDTMELGSKKLMYSAAKAEYLNKMRKAGSSELRISFQEQAMGFLEWSDGANFERQLVQQVGGDKAAARYDRVGQAAGQGSVMDVPGDPIRGPGAQATEADRRSLDENTRATNALTKALERFREKDPTRNGGGDPVDR